MFGTALTSGVRGIVFLVVPVSETPPYSSRVHSLSFTPVTCHWVPFSTPVSGVPRDTRSVPRSRNKIHVALQCLPDRVKGFEIVSDIPRFLSSRSYPSVVGSLRLRHRGDVWSPSLGTPVPDPSLSPRRQTPSVRPTRLLDLYSVPLFSRSLYTRLCSPRGVYTTCFSLSSDSFGEGADFDWTAKSPPSPFGTGDTGRRGTYREGG